MPDKSVGFVTVSKYRHPCGAVVTGVAPIPTECPEHGTDCKARYNRNGDDYTAEQKLRFAQQEGELIDAECEAAGISGTRPLFERVREMRIRLQNASVLVRSWLREADEIDADGDYCCGQTRRHDAKQLRAVLQLGAQKPK